MSDWRDTYPAADRGYEPLLESIVESGWVIAIECRVIA